MELNSERETANEKDDTYLFTGTLRGLESSYSSMKHIRLIGITPDPHQYHEHDNNNHNNNHHHHHHPTDFVSFKNLRVLTVDSHCLEPLSEHPETPSPESLEVFQLLYHFDTAAYKPMSENFWKNNG